MNRSEFQRQALHVLARPSAQIALDLLVIAAAGLAIFWPFFFTRATFNVDVKLSDWHLLAQTAYTYTGQRLASGEFPLWNTDWFAGYPHLAVPSNSVLYPTTILFGLFDFGLASKIVALGHLYIFAGLNYFLGRDMFRSRCSSLFLAFCAFVGSAMQWPLNGGALWTVTTLTWLPLAFLALRRLLRSGHPVWALVLAPVIALMYLGGDPVTMAFSLLFLGAYAAWTLTGALLARSAPASRVIFTGALCAAGVIGGLALAAPQLLPSQEYIEQSVRKDGVTYQYLRGMFRFTLFDNYKTSAFFMMAPNSFIPGKVTLTLTFVALTGYAFREALAFWMFTLFMWALGDTSEQVFESVVRHVPVLNSIRGITSLVLITVFVSYLLAASGLDVLIRSAAAPNPRRSPWILAAVISFACLISSAVSDPTYWATAVTTPAFALLAVVVLFRPVPSAVLGAVLLALLAAEGISLHHFRDHRGDPENFVVDPRLTEFSAARSNIDRVVILGPSKTGIVQGAAVTLLTGDRNVEGYHALFLHRYARLLRDVAGVPIAKLDAEGRLDEQGNYGTDWISAAALPVLDLLNVRYILRNRAPVPFIRSEILAKSSRFSFEVLDGLRIYQNHEALPPVFPIHEVLPVPSDEAAIALLREGRLDYRKQVSLTPEFPTPALSPATGPEPITLKNYGPNSVEATVLLTAPALLVLSEMWYPGWYAQIDGGPSAPVLCVDTALQAIPVPAGDHAVRFFFRPQSFINGLIISAVTALLWLVCAVVMFRRRIVRRSDS